MFQVTSIAILLEFVERQKMSVSGDGEGVSENSHESTLIKYVFFKEFFNKYHSESKDSD